MITSRALISLVGFIIIFSDAIGQNTPSWHLTPAPPGDNRYDDMTFLNKDLGWAVNFSGVGDQDS
jgi:hypothetical protein